MIPLGVKVGFGTRIYVAVGSGEDAAAWGAGDDPASARADAIERVERSAEEANERPWEPGEDRETWSANLSVVLVEGPDDAVRAVVGELVQR